MSLTKFTGSTDVISQLPNRPAISANELKAKFDEAETAIKNYLNDTLTVEVEGLIETEVEEGKVVVENVLTSTSTTNALSAAQGKTLNDTIISLDNSKQKKITVGTGTPTGGTNGDIYIQLF
jgi:hypothetical protein